MKVKKGWEEFLKKEMPDELRAKVLRRTRVAMGEREAAPSLFAYLLKPALGMSLLAAAALAVFFLRSDFSGSGKRQEIVFRDDLEMIQNADMLQELSLLRKLAEFEKLEKKKWPKKRS